MSSSLRNSPLSTCVTQKQMIIAWHGAMNHVRAEGEQHSAESTQIRNQCTFCFCSEIRLANATQRNISDLEATFSWLLDPITEPIFENFHYSYISQSIFTQVNTYHSRHKKILNYYCILFLKLVREHSKFIKELNSYRNFNFLNR